MIIEVIYKIYTNCDRVIYKLCAFIFRWGQTLLTSLVSTLDIMKQNLWLHDAIERKVIGHDLPRFIFCFQSLTESFKDYYMFFSFLYMKNSYLTYNIWDIQYTHEICTWFCWALSPCLICWSQDKLANILQTFSNAYYWMKLFVFWIKLPCNLYPKVKLTACQYWFSYWLEASRQQAITRARSVLPSGFTGLQWMN